MASNKMTRKPRAQAPPQTLRRLAACIATARSGQRCKAAPMHGTKYCPLHTEGVASKLGQRGGRRRAIFDPDNLLPFNAPTNAHEQAAILAQLEVETHQGKIDPKVASTISTLANAYLGALELIEFGEKLKVLEARMGIADPLTRLERDETTGRFVEQ